jgi:hypothetical protein
VAHTNCSFLCVYAAVINFKNAEAGAKALQQAQNVGFDCELLSEKRYLPAPLAFLPFQ